jgi:F1F0 ATPase subunit 2
MDAAAMSALAPNGDALRAFVAHVGAPLLVGGLLGAIYFLSLLWTARLLAKGPALLPLALYALRFVLLAVILTVTARASGATALLAAVVGLLMARMSVLHWGAAS